MTTSLPIAAPGETVPEFAVSYADVHGNAVVASNATPLPVNIVGGGASASLADQSVVDAAGVYWLVRDNGTALSYLNWANGIAGTPTAPVAPAGKLTGEQIRGTQYDATATGTGYATGDVLEHIIVLNIAATPATVITSTWANITQGSVLAAAPAPASLAEKGGAVVAANLLVGGSAVGGSNPVPVSGAVTANLGTLNGAATDASLQQIRTAIGTPLQAGSAVTANAGTNLNTSALALESGGNLAGINTKLTTSANGIKVDGSAVTQPVSGAVTANLQVAAAAVSATNPVPMMDGYLAPSATNWTSATAANTALTSNVAGYDGVMISLVATGTITGGVITFEAFDGAAWLPCKVYPLNSYSSYSTITLATGMNTGFQADIAGCTQFRARLSTAIVGTGSIIVTNNVTSAPLVPGVTVGLDPTQPLPAGTNAIGSITNTSFGISGTLPAFAATPTVNVGTMPTTTVSWSGQTVGLTGALPAGTNTIGNVNVDNVTDSVTANASVSAAGVVVSASTAGFAGGSFQVNSAGTSCTITFEQSNDNATWFTLQCQSISAATANTTTTTTTGIYAFNSAAAYVRARVSTYGSGTVTVYLTQKRVAPPVSGTALSPGSATIGALAAGSATIGAIAAGNQIIGMVQSQTGYTDSTTALGASATFTGTGRATTTPYCFFRATAYADQAGTLYIDCSLDTGSTYQAIASVAVAAASAQSLVVPMVGAAGAATLYRVRYVNGATAQATFRLASAFTTH